MSVSGLRIALDLTDLGARLVAQKHRRENPAATEEEVEAAVARWMSDRSQAPNGDGVGRRVAFEQRD